jgi:hypothetical protein
VLLVLPALFQGGVVYREVRLAPPINDRWIRRRQIAEEASMLSNA